MLAIWEAMTRQARGFTALAKADLNSLLDSDLGGVAGIGWRWLPSLAFGAEHGIIGLHATPSSTPKMTQRAGGDTLAASQTEPGEPSLAAVSLDQGEAPVLEGTAAIHITCGCNVLKKQVRTAADTGLSALVCHIRHRLERMNIV